MTEEEEFREIYKLDVVEIPTNKPMIRKDLPDVVYKTERGKFNAVIDDIVAHHATASRSSWAPFPLKSRRSSPPC